MHVGLYVCMYVCMHVCVHSARFGSRGHDSAWYSGRFLHVRKLILVLGSMGGCSVNIAGHDLELLSLECV